MVESRKKMCEALGGVFFSTRVHWFRYFEKAQSAFKRSLRGLSMYKINKKWKEEDKESARRAESSD